MWKNVHFLSPGLKSMAEGTDHFHHKMKVISDFSHNGRDFRQVLGMGWSMKLTVTSKRSEDGWYADPESL